MAGGVPAGHVMATGEPTLAIEVHVLPTVAGQLPPVPAPSLAVSPSDNGPPSGACASARLAPSLVVSPSGDDPASAICEPESLSAVGLDPSLAVSPSDGPPSVSCDPEPPSI